MWTGFAPNVARRTDRGLLIEETRTNVVLHNRDLTNAAWVKTNMTAVKDQTGVDGVANSASKITATAANATVLQTITLTLQRAVADRLRQAHHRLRRRPDDDERRHDVDGCDGDGRLDAGEFRRDAGQSERRVPARHQRRRDRGGLRAE